MKNTLKTALLFCTISLLCTNTFAQSLEGGGTGGLGTGGGNAISGGAHVVCNHPPYSPNRDWSTDTTDEADTLKAINTCNANGGYAVISP